MKKPAGEAGRVNGTGFVSGGLQLDGWPWGLSNKIPTKPHLTAGGSWSAVGGRKKVRWKGEHDGGAGVGAMGEQGLGQRWAVVEPL
ncbi:MAG TPA: hypothetical protein DDW55_13330 [Gammaproteobacteria bacterium]|nr:hypothetical protein [Gammaproteobacteria bacterium]